MQQTRDRAALLAALDDSTRLLRTSDVALLFQVSERTVAEWARRGRIPAVRTPGGHRRYPAPEIQALLTQVAQGEAFGGVAAEVYPSV
ncbi:MAG: helix-turn-helix domain-containing protein [Acidimicrobiia bacterium]